MQLSGVESTFLNKKWTGHAEITQETCTEKETPEPATRQSTKGAVPSKGEAAVSGGVVGTEHREDQGDGVRGGGLTTSIREFFPCVVSSTMKIFRLEGANSLDRRTIAGDNRR